MEVADLRNLMTSHFDRTELRNLCFDLGISHEEIPAETKSEMTREIVTYCLRHGRIVDLLERCRQLRPQLAWPDISDEAVQEYLSTAGDQWPKDHNTAEGGDTFNVQIGDVSHTQIAIGKDITQVQSAQANEIARMLDELAAAIRSEVSPGQHDLALQNLKALTDEVKAKEPNLQKLEALKNFFTGLGGGIADVTNRLFAGEAMQSVLKIAAEIAVAATLKQLGGDG